MRSIRGTSWLTLPRDSNKTLRFAEDEVAALGRVTGACVEGVRGLDLKKVSSSSGGGRGEARCLYPPGHQGTTDAKPALIKVGRVRTGM